MITIISMVTTVTPSPCGKHECTIAAGLRRRNLVSWEESAGAIEVPSE
jgi:hypothetical protein